MNRERTPLIAPDPALLEAIYRTTVTPESYDALMQRWQEALDAAVDDLGAAREKVADDTDLIQIEDTVPHLQTSFRILEALGRADAANHTGNGIPKCIIALNGTVVWYNGIAARDLDLTKTATYRTLKMGESGRALVEAAFETLGQSGAPLQPFVLAVESPRRGRAIHMIASAFHDRADGPHLKLEQAEVPWNAATRAMMQSAFDLTAAEIDIVSMLVLGHPLKAVAGMRGRKLATIRTQLKSILRKTRTQSQNELSRLCLTLASYVPPAQPGGGVDDRLRFFTVRDSRSMPYHEYGPTDGAPVLFVHGMLDGVQLTERAHRLLRTHRIRVIAPERPHFGSAEGDRSDIEGALTAFGGDVAALVDHLGIDRLVIAGHMSGALPAYAAAAVLGKRVIAVAPISGGVPIVSAHQFKMMSPRQRMMAHTARYTPSALPFIIRAGVHKLDSGGAQQIMDALYPDSEPDRRACAQTEIHNIVSAGYRHAIAQGHWAFRVDAHHVVRDWTPLVEASDCPIHLIHGRHDPVVVIGSVRDFACRYPERAMLHEHADQGQLVLHTDPEFVIERLARLFATVD